MDNKHHGPRGSFACLGALLAAIFVIVWAGDAPRRDIKPANIPAAIIPAAEAGNGDSNQPSQAVDSGEAPDRGNFKAFRATIAVADTLTTTNVLSLPALQVQGRTTALLGTRFTDASATVSFELAYVWRNPVATSDTSVTTRAFSWKTATWAVPWQNQSWTVADNVIKGWSATTTLTAGTQQHEGSYYKATVGDYYLDLQRADTVRLVVTTGPSAGTVTFWIGS